MAELSEGNKESWMETVWFALHNFREICIPEGEEDCDEQWDEICTAMAWIREVLDLPDEVDNET